MHAKGAKVWLLAVVAWGLLGGPVLAQTLLVTNGSSWKYLTGGVDPGPSWNLPGYSDSHWTNAAPAPLGANAEGGVQTTIDIGPAANVYPALFFRHTFTVADASQFGNLIARLMRDDGAVVYLNGNVIVRDRVPDGTGRTAFLGSGAVSGADETNFFLQPPIVATALVSGVNVLAAEVHQDNAASSDLTFDFELVGNLRPTVAMSSPTDGQVIAGPTDITLSATASDADGVARVEFYQNGVRIDEDTTSPYSLVWSNVSEGAYSLVAVATDINSLSATSAPVNITVTDPNPPAIASVAAIATNQVNVTFTKRVAAPSATTVGNYTISPGITVFSANYAGANSNTIVLTVSPLTLDVTNTLTVNNVQDLNGNTIAPNSQATFVLRDFIGANIGNPAIAGSTSPAGNGYAVTGGGTNIFGGADQFFFNHRLIGGDFDLNVRVDSLAAGDHWAKAGLMARENLAANSRHASAFATPSVNGTFFAYRTNAGGATINTGSFPAGYPNTWLRLKRTGATLTGYAGVDGQNWVQLGTVTLSGLPSVLYVGMAVTGASATEDATAQFRDIGDATGEAVGTVDIPFELPGPSSRNTGLVITEIMYHPKPSNNLEFIEVFNAGLISENLGGWRISGAVDYTFPPNTILPAGGFLVVARFPEQLETAHGISGVLGPWDGASTNALPDDQGNVRLRNRAGAMLLQINYQGDNPWPISADGAGHSLVLARPSYGEGDPRAWAPSDVIGGSPGRFDGYTAEPLRAVMINEFLAHTDLPLEDFIELYNHSNQPVDVSGAYLSDDRDTNKFKIPPNTIIPARGFVSFVCNTETTGFALSSGGERIYFVNPSQTRVLEALVFEAQANGVSRGRYPNGGPGYQELASRTPGAANAPLLIREVVINELMFHSITENEDDEYVELYNRSGTPVDVSNWTFSDGIDYRFPANTIIPPNGYLVVAANQANLLTKYAHLNSGNTIGNYGGNLDNGGERIALARPDYFLVTNNNVVSTQANYVVVDEVIYADQGRWTRWADGAGSSLELIDPDSDNSLVANWTDSDETAKSAWTNFYFRDLTDHIYPRGSPGADLNEVQLMILGGGEVLIDDIEVRADGITGQGPNLMANGTFNNGLTGWTVQGNHIQSRLEPAGPNNPSQSLRLRASAGGDNGVNRVESDLTSPLGANAQCSIRANLRWLKGHPDVLLRLHGGGLEGVVTLPIPRNLGTPGQANSRLVVNAGPAIHDVNHSPALPAANERVVITARVADPDGIGSVQVQYRLDPDNVQNSLAMRDDGTGGDAVANDGLYSATLPPLAGGTLVAFHVRATDAAAATALFPPDVLPHIRECLIRYGDPIYAGNIGVYRIWMTTTNITEWRIRELLSNEAQDGTFVYNNYRVIYNAGARYRGSPFIRPGYGGPTVGATGYVWIMPEDDPFLGVDELNLDSLEPQGRDSTALRELTAFSILEDLDWPASYQRFVHVVVNGVNNAARNVPIYSDSQQPNSSYISTWFPDNDDGEIFKIDDWFEFTDNPVRMQANKCASMQNFVTTGGVKKKARYRWGWEKKFNRSLNDDYSSLFAAADALNAPDSVYVQQVEDVFEVEQWLGAIAFRHVTGDWDGYGYNRGKNQFQYRPRDGKWRMLQWDLDFALGCTGGHGPGQDLFSVSLEGDSGQNHMPEISRMFNHPHFRRAYLRTLLRIANGPLQVNSYLPILDARYRALQANGIVTVSPYVPSGAQNISIPTWLDQRRTTILGNSGVGPFVNATFRITSPANVTTNTNVVTITGTAPLLVKDIMLNGVAWPVTWVNVTSFTARVVVEAPSNVFQITGTDVTGNTNTLTQTVTVNYTGTAPDPQDMIVINEIMYNPAVSEASFVELYNRSTSTFDLTGWRLNGADFTFPAGSIMNPGQYLVLAKNRGVFINTYTNVPVYTEFDGQLDNGGETLTLIKPGLGGTNDVVVDKVKYDDDPPWPAAADGTGPSLQLFDSAQDNARVSNWTDGAGWRFVTYTGTIQGNPPNLARGTNFYLFMGTAGEVFIDDMVLVQGSVPEAGPNLITNGDFESPLAGTWVIQGNHSNTVRSSSIVHTGNGSLHLIAAGNGSVSGLGGHNLRQFIPGHDSNMVFTLSFWLLPSNNGTTLNVRTAPGSAFQLQNLSIRPLVASPGGLNVITGTLPPYPLLWLNEVQAVNDTGIADNMGERDPWLELYNSTSSPIPLGDYYLANNYSGLLQWALPAVNLNPGEFKIIWLDGETTETTPTHLHAGFGITGPTGSVALVRVVSGVPQIVDYLNYVNQQPSRSYGDYPDAQLFDRQVFFQPTPGNTNIAADITVFINEWMADNVSTLADPADGQFEDWVELYNPGTEPVDLSNYILSDNIAAPGNFRFPANTIIPAGGFLLVWADNEDNQNRPDRIDVHASFALRAGGEQIALFSPSGFLIDGVTFEQQQPDISEGRYPDAGPGPFPAMTTPTPRAPNIVGGGGENRQPQISPIGDKYVIRGQTLQFNVTATDPDAGQTLTYSLTGQPLGATIGSSSGLFQWTPAPDYPPGMTTVTVHVADNGTPPLNNSRGFAIYLSLPPQVTITPGVGGISLSFPTVAGKTYQVRYKDELTQAAWLSLGAPQLATGTSLQINDTFGVLPQRFYTIEVLD